MSNRLVSIIVPVYNTERYLNRCLDSLINQSYSNFELIIVDDGSTDNSLEICKKYQTIDERIKVYHKANGGLSSARNFALDVIKGEYVTLVDSDDYVTPNFLSTLVNVLEQNNSDISVCDENRFYEKNGILYFYGSPYKKVSSVIKQTSEEGLNSYLKQILYDASACGKLYKSGLFKGVRYPEGFNYEDIGTTYKIFCKANSITFTPEPMYLYYQRENSILHDVTPYKLKKNLSDGIKMTEMQRDFISVNYPKLKLAAECRCFSMYCRCVGLYHIHLDKNLEHYCWERVVILRKYFLFGEFRKKVKFAAFLSFGGRYIFRYIYNMVQ